MAEPDETPDEHLVRDALPLSARDFDAERREQHLARALDVFDEQDFDAQAAGAVVPLRRRRALAVAAIAAAVIAVAAIGGVLATRDRSATTATARAEAPVTTTTAPSPAGTARAAPTPAAPVITSLGDFPTFDALRAAATAIYRPEAAASTTSSANFDERTPDAANALGAAGCAFPGTGTGRPVEHAAASIAGAPVTVWIVVDTDGGRRVVVVDDATCAVRTH
jgi:hypothetical protein